jgi:hypothetical protein
MSTFDAARLQYVPGSGTPGYRSPKSTGLVFRQRTGNALTTIFE